MTCLRSPRQLWQCQCENFQTQSFQLIVDCDNAMRQRLSEKNHTGLTFEKFNGWIIFKVMLFLDMFSACKNQKKKKKYLARFGACEDLSVLLSLWNQLFLRRHSSAQKQPLFESPEATVFGTDWWSHSSGMSRWTKAKANYHDGTRTGFSSFSLSWYFS